MPLLAACWLAAACAHAPARNPTPAWAIHTDDTPVDRAASVESLQSRLLRELDYDVYRHGYASPEQLGVLALSELRQDHSWDAAALLALASYRRLVQAQDTAEYIRDEGWGAAVSAASMTVRPGYRLDIPRFRQAYDDEAARELDTLARAHFDDHLERASASVGASLSVASQQRDTDRIVMGHLHDPYGAAAALAQRRFASQQPLPERIAHPKLVAAICARLTSDLDKPRLRQLASFYLASMPIAHCRAAALQRSPLLLQPGVVRAAALLYRTDPASVLTALASRNGAARANAALALGMSRALAELPQLEAALAAEGQTSLRRIFKLALVWLGERQHLQLLTQALYQPDDSLGLAILGWLPPEEQARLPVGALAELLGAQRAGLSGKLVVATILSRIGRRQALDEATLQALLDFTFTVRNNEDALSVLESAFARLEQLDRGQILVVLKARKYPLRPWLARLKRMAIPADLELLDDLFRSRLKEPGLQLALGSVVSMMPGIEAQAMLERWLVETPSIRTSLAMLLITRSDLQKERLHGVLVQLRDPSKLIVAIALDASASQIHTRTLLQTGSVQERYLASQAARLFGRAEMRDALWPNVLYSDASDYPADLALRHMALSALLDIELNRQVAPAPTRDGMPAEAPDESLDD